MPKLRFQRSDPQAFCVQKALALNTKYTMLENTVDGVARDVYFYYGTNGNIRCRRDMYRPARGVKTFLNKGNECGHVFGIFSG